MKIKSSLNTGINRNSILFYILCIFGVLWFLPYVNKGIDVTDAAYYMNLYKGYFQDDFSGGTRTLLTQFVGALIYHISPKGQMLIINIAGWLCYGVSGIIIYNVLKRKKKDSLILVSVICGTFFCFTWVHAFNYNSLSMLLQVIGIALLIAAVRSEKKKYCFVAGMVIGINIFVRLPNVLQACLGVILLLYFGLARKNWRQGWSRLALYALGGIAGVTAGMTYAVFKMGTGGLYHILFDTVNTASGEGSHGIANILGLWSSGLIRGYRLWLMRVLFLALLFAVRWFAGKFISEKLAKVADVSICVILFVFAVYSGYSKETVDLCYMFAALTIAVGAAGSLFLKEEYEVRAVSFLILLSESILVIGTDNGWYYNVVFIMFPLAGCILILKTLGKVYGQKKIFDFLILFVLSIYIIGGIKYGTTYVYRDSANSELKYGIEADEYWGMKTSRGRSVQLNTIQDVLSKLEYSNKKVISLGDCNMTCLITDLEPALSSSWPDLQSYSFERFKKETTAAIKEEPPILVFFDLEHNGIYRSMEKYEYLMKTAHSDSYKVYFENEDFSIYVPVDM